MLSAVLGVVSKEIVATVPVGVLAYWLCFLRRAAPRRSRAAPRWPGGAAARCRSPTRWCWRGRYLMPASEPVDPDAPRAWLYIPTAGFGLEGITPWQYLLTQFGVIIWYLRLFVLPTRQMLRLRLAVRRLGLARRRAPAARSSCSALVAAAVLAYRRYPLATFCLAWVFITLAPTSSIIPLRDAAFEHRMYLPIVGLAWLVIVGGYDLLGWVAVRRGRDVRARCGAPAPSAAAAWIVAARHRDGGAQRRHAGSDRAGGRGRRAKAPQQLARAVAYAEALIDAGRPDDAMRGPRGGAASQSGQSARRASQLGELYLRAGRLDDAERVLEPATEELEESVVAAA